MSLAKKAATTALLTFSRRSWGLTAVLMPSLVESLGPYATVRWMVGNIPGYERAIKDMGPLRANLAFTIASLLNGCSYCVYAHGRAFELYYFEQHNKLFPLDDHTLVSLIPLTDDDVRKTLEDALVQAGLGAELKMFARIFALKLEGASPTEPEDGHLLHAIQMYDVLNFCAIQSQAPLDDAHDRINKDTELKTRYAEARLRAADDKRRAEAMSHPSMMPLDDPETNGIKSDGH